MRDTPGYTNYVVGVKKNISGAVSSAELKRYYSNIDAEIYINGEWYEDISKINWQIVQQTMPLFGYNSYIWDDIAQGTRIISGQFIVNFTGPNTISKAIKEGTPTEYSNGSVNSNDGTDFEKEETYVIQNDKIVAKPNSGLITTNPVHNKIWGSKFDIDIVCGEKESKGGPPVHIILKNCYITNSYQQRDTEGGAVVEVYQFVSQDFVTIE